MAIDSYGNEIFEQQELFTNSWGVHSGFARLRDAHAGRTALTTDHVSVLSLRRWVGEWTFASS